MFIFFETLFEIVFEDLIRPFVCDLANFLLFDVQVTGIAGLLFKVLNFLGC